MIHQLQLVVEHLDTHLNEPTNQNSIKVPEVVKPTNNKTLLKYFGDQCNKQPIVLPLIWIKTGIINLKIIPTRYLKSLIENIN